MAAEKIVMVGVIPEVVALDAGDQVTWFSNAGHRDRSIRSAARLLPTYPGSAWRPPLERNASRRPESELLRDTIFTRRRGCWSRRSSSAGRLMEEAIRSPAEKRGPVVGMNTVDSSATESAGVSRSDAKTSRPEPLRPRLTLSSPIFAGTRGGGRAGARIPGAGRPQR